MNDSTVQAVQAAQPVAPVERNPNVAEGRAFADDYLQAHGVESAVALHEQMVPRGVPCALDLGDWQYWTAFWQRVQEFIRSGSAAQ